jgi:DNA-binding CsgD family transcriptional regulator
LLALSEIAEVLGISEATTKTHFHRLFATTGTERHADLVKLVAGFAGPLAKSEEPR